MLTRQTRWGVKAEWFTSTTGSFTKFGLKGTNTLIRKGKTPGLSISL